jgi:hypothetical protein
MPSVNVQEQVAASAEQVWQVLADFGGVEKWSDPRFIKSCTCDGNEPGAVRTITLADGAVIRERLEAVDHDARRFSYCIVGTCPLPVANYLATAKVTELPSGGCQVDWQSTFEALGSTDEAEKMIRGVYTGGVAGIRKLLGV